MHPAGLCQASLLAECSIRNDRRSGPGGQHRNKVETAVIVCHTPTQVQAEASERRSKPDNKRVAIFRLRLNLALQVREPISLPRSVSDLWASRSSAGRIRVAPTHQDYPTLLAELLDVLETCHYSMPAAAEHFGNSSSQLIRLLRIHPPALQSVNARRSGLDLHKLT